jgi:hypothetical protein
MEQTTKPKDSIDMISRNEKKLIRWNGIIETIFNRRVPSNCCWDVKEYIIDVLNIVGSEEIGYGTNITYLPISGTTHLEFVNSSYEYGCIDINNILIVKPIKLIFQKYGKNHELSYFRLETMKMEPTSIYKKIDSEFEELVELSPLNYEKIDYWNSGYYIDDDGDEQKLPQGSRPLSRYIKGGAFVTFVIQSPYDKFEKEHPGIHNKLSSDQFSELIAKLA